MHRRSNEGGMNSKGLSHAEVRDLFRDYAPLVRRRALSLLGDEALADEATQEVFVRCLTRSEGFEGRSRVSTWLYRVTTNYCLTQIRNERRRAELLEEKVVPASSDREDASSELQTSVRRMLAAADERQAKAAVGVYLEGMSHHEAAKLLGVSRRSVGNLLVRFEAFARAYMDGRPPALAMAA